MNNEPHASKLTCGAKTRNKTSCKNNPMTNGRCRLHGGKSTGPRTKEGLERSKKANFKHGYYSEAEKALRRKIKALLRLIKKSNEKML